MGKIMKNGVVYSGNNTVEVTQQEYDTLTQAQKENGSIYFVTDGIPTGGNPYLDMCYPVGSYYETSDSTFDPNTAWGGTWADETRQLLFSSGSKTVNAATGYELCTITLKANTTYLLLGHVTTDSGANLTTLANISLKSGTYSSYWSNLGRTTTSSGQGTHATGFIKTTSDVVISLNSYGYYTTSHTETGKIIAIPVDRPAGVYRWHRTA